MTIDLPPQGKPGIEAKLLRPGVVYIQGSDHWRDWYHHVQLIRDWRFETPAKREREAARQILDQILAPEIPFYTIGAHSLGGAVANEIGAYLDWEGIPYHVYLFGPKQPIEEVCQNITVYRVRGDIVPLCHPFRPRYPEETVIEAGELPFWKAHGPDTYDEVREKHGLK